MKDNKVIDITPLLNKKLQQEPHVKEAGSKNFNGGLYLKFSQDSATFTVYFENDRGENMDITPLMMEEVVYRMFEVIQALQEEFQLDL